MRSLPTSATGFSVAKASLLALGLGTGLSLGSGCGQSNLDRFADSYTDAVAVLCTCWEVIGSADEQACIDSYPVVDRVCLRTAQRQYGSIIDPAMRCRANAAQALLVCASRGDCADSRETTCANAFAEAVIDCPAIADNAAANALQACIRAPR